MTIKFNSKETIEYTYSKYEYSRYDVLYTIMRRFRSYYEFEKKIGEMINLKLTHKILHNNENNYDIRITNFTKLWCDDDSAEKLHYILSTLNKKDDFFKILLYTLRNKIKDNSYGTLEFKFYAFNVKINYFYRHDGII